MTNPLDILKARPLLMSTILFGVAVALLVPPGVEPGTPALWGWNAGAWAYLLASGAMMMRADHQRLRRNAMLHAEGLTTVMSFAIAAVIASLWAILREFSDVKDAMAHGHGMPHLVFAGATLIGSWLLLPTLFAVAYASHYYARADKPGGLQFPSADEDEPPDYADFLYFSLTLAATAQTSDVCITRRELRRWVTVQAVLSFAFNTLLLALAVNIAAGLL